MHPYEQKVRRTHKLSEAKIRESIEFIPHAKQIEVLKNQTRFTTMCWGRRCGKTMLISYIAFLKIIKSNQNVWIAAPTYDLAKRSWEYLLQFVQKFNKKHGKFFNINKSHHQITTVSGSKLELKSTDNPSSLLGAGLDLLIIDEAARIQEDVWRTYLRPTLADRQGDAVFISTPYGKNWFYELMVKGTSPDASHQDYSYFHMRTVENTTLPHIKEEIEKARLELPANDFLQEFEAEFIEGAGSVFRNVRDCVYDTNTTNTFPLEADTHNQDHAYQGGLDLARLTDFSVLTIIDKSYQDPLTKENRLKVVAIDRFNELDWKLQKPRINLLSQKYNNPPINAEVNNIGDALIEDLHPNFQPFKTTNESKKEIINNLAILFEQRKILIPNIPILINELESFSYEVLPSGKIRYQAPPGLHDDMVMSLALATHNAKPIDTRITQPMYVPETAWVDEEY